MTDTSEYIQTKRTHGTHSQIANSSRHFRSSCQRRSARRAFSTVRTAAVASSSGFADAAGAGRTLSCLKRMASSTIGRFAPVASQSQRSSCHSATFLRSGKKCCRMAAVNGVEGRLKSNVRKSNVDLMQVFTMSLTTAGDSGHDNGRICSTCDPCRANSEMPTHTYIHTRAGTSMMRKQPISRTLLAGQRYSHDSAACGFIILVPCKPKP